MRIKQNEVSLGKRFGAYLIDWYVGALFTALPISLVGQKLYGTMTNQNITSFDQPAGLIAGICGVLLAIYYYFIIPIGKNKGQTFGKKVFKIKIVQLNGENATIRQLFIRQVIGIMIIEGVMVSASSIWHQIIMILTGINIVTPLMYIGFIIVIISAILFIFKGEHRTLHDYLSKTKVINE